MVHHKRRNFQRTVNQLTIHSSAEVPSPIRVGLLVESAKSLKFSFGCKKCRVPLL